jgi:hypothetical protein
MEIKQQIAIENASWSKGDQWRSMEINGDQGRSPSRTRPGAAHIHIRQGNQTQSEGHQRPSEAIRRHQTQSDTIQIHSDAITPSDAIQTQS